MPKWRFCEMSELIITYGSFSEFPETHWVGEKCIYCHQGVNTFMPDALKKYDKALCVITELEYWKIPIDRFCCKVKFTDYECWTTLGHLKPLQKPKIKPPVIDTVLAKANNPDDMEALMASLNAIEVRWLEWLKSKKLEKSGN